MPSCTPFNKKDLAQMVRQHGAYHCEVRLALYSLMVDAADDSYHEICAVDHKCTRTSDTDLDEVFHMRLQRRDAQVQLEMCICTNFPCMPNTLQVAYSVRFDTEVFSDFKLVQLDDPREWKRVSEDLTEFLQQHLNPKNKLDHILYSMGML